MGAARNQTRPRDRTRRESAEVVSDPTASIDRIRDWRCDDADTGEDLAEKIREYHIPDFSNWKNHDAFEAAFADLRRDLRAQA